MHRSIIHEVTALADYIEGKISLPFKKGLRVVVKGDDGYLIGTVTMQRGPKVYVRYDSGDKETLPKTSNRWAGEGVAKQRKSAIPKSRLKEFLKGVPAKKSKPKTNKKTEEKPPERIPAIITGPKAIATLKRIQDVLATSNISAKLHKDMLYFKQPVNIKRVLRKGNWVKVPGGYKVEEGDAWIDTKLFRKGTSKIKVVTSGSETGVGKTYIGVIK